MSEVDITGLLRRLTKARQSAGLSQGQAAKLMGYTSASTISHYESGLRGLEVETMLKLCQIYGVSSIWVLTGENPYFDPQPIVEAAQRAKVASEDLKTILDEFLMTAVPMTEEEAS